MNFYKHHLGDYAASTAHLTWDEDCAYRRLIDQYYKREAAIPSDVKDACRLARAQTPVQRRAVETILREFFRLQDDGWHQKRCDEELAAANAQAETNRRIAEEREAKKRARLVNESTHESFNASSNEAFTNRPPEYMGEREPSQTPDSRLQTPDPSGGEQLRSSPPDKPARKPRGARRVPEDFVVTDELQAWVSEKAPQVDWRRETEKFRDWEFKDPKTDWPATWRGWMRKAQEDAEGARKGVNGHAADDWTGRAH